MNRIRACIAILAIPLGGLGVGLGCLGQARADVLRRPHRRDRSTARRPRSKRRRGPMARCRRTGRRAGDDATAIDDADAVGDAASDVPRTPATTSSTRRRSRRAAARRRRSRTAAQCGAACDTTHSSDAGCAAGACQYTCSPGFGDCQPTAPDLNGCETPLTTAYELLRLRHRLRHDPQQRRRLQRHELHVFGMPARLERLQQRGAERRGMRVQLPRVLRRRGVPAPAQRRLRRHVLRLHPAGSVHVGPRARGVHRVHGQCSRVRELSRAGIHAWVRSSAAPRR